MTCLVITALPEPVLYQLMQDDAPGPIRALPLDLDCNLAIRKMSHKPRWGLGGRIERAASARRRRAVDIAMINSMQDARL